MRPYIQNGSGIMALEPREQVILYLDGDRDREARTPMEMAKALQVPLPSLYRAIKNMSAEEVIAPDGKVESKYVTGPDRTAWTLTEGGKRLAKGIHHIRMVRF